MARDIDKLRAEVARAQRLAGDKVRRVERATGAKLGGSSYDVRRDPSKVARYNKRQLEKYLGELKGFRGRNVQFVAGAKGAPIPAHLAKRFESVVNSYNKVSGRELSNVSKVKLPGGMTIGEREEIFMPEGRGMKARAANRPRGRFDVPVSSVLNEKSLLDIETMLRSRMSESKINSTIAAQRFQMGEMLGNVGETRSIRDVNELTDDQFNVLWNYTDFADTLSQRYEAVKNMSVVEEVKTSDDFKAEIVETLAWAKKIKV